MNMQGKLVTLQEEFNKRLEKFLDGKIAEFKSMSSLMEKIMREIRNFVMGDGKRIRPIFVLYGYLAAGGRERNKIMETAIFAELIHDYFLVHDDIIDQDNLRHGQPSFHKRYETFYQKQPNAKHLGTSGAILAGDLLTVLGYDILSKTKFNPVLINEAMLELNRIVADVIGGQVLDVYLGLDHFLGDKEILEIQRYKTSRYTVDGPMQIGAILAGADSEILEQVSQYAIPLGIAFQIQDDILGMFGDTKRTGKPSGADLREGKQTLLILKAREKASVPQKKIIGKSFGNHRLTDSQLAKVRKIIIDTGSLKYSQDLARKFVNQAEAAVKKSNFSQEAKDFLGQIGEYIIGRDK